MENDNVTEKTRRFFNKGLVKGAAAIAVGAVIGIVLNNRLGNSDDDS